MPHAELVFRRNWLIVLTCWVASLCPPVHAEPRRVQNLRQTEQYFFDAFNVDSGLPGVVVNSVCQTRDGYIWIATGGGLARFDGVRFTSYRPPTTSGFTTPLINLAFESRDGTLWIGTAAGLICYRNHGFEPVGLEGIEVHSIAEDRAGRLWIGTYGRGLYVREHGVIRHIDDARLAHSGYILRVVPDSRDRVWIATDADGVVCFENGTFRSFAEGPAPGASVDAICEQPEGTLWFGSRNSGLYRWREGSLTHLARADGLAGDAVYDLEPASDGGVWIVSAQVQHLSDPVQPAITTIPDVPHGQLISIFEDREGSIWLSGKERGLLRGSAMPYRLIGAHDGLPDGVRALAQDPKGNLWLVAQGHGLYCVSPDGTLSRPLAPESGPPPNCTAVLVARDGAIWVGTVAGLHILHDGNDTVLPEYRGVYGLFQDSRGDIWIGTAAEGLFRYRSGKFASVRTPFAPVHTPSGVQISLARSFCEGPDGTVYAAVWGAGLLQVKGDQAILFDQRSGLPTNDVRAVYVDAQNHVWLGFRGHGLGLWRPGACWSPPELAQAVFDHVVAITEDGAGQLWLGTPAGVMWVAKADLLAAASGQKDVRELRIAQVTRSLRNASVWSGSQSVLCTTQDHHFLFATREGILAIDPRREPGRNVPPPVYIEHASIDGRRLDLDQGVTLAPGAKNLVLEFTAPTFVEPNQVLFRYKLDGYDAEWTEGKNRRTAAYSNLAPGRYMFHVAACNADGVWNMKGAALAIVQQPHFYQTSWFFSLIGVGFVAAGFGIHRWSHYRLKVKLERLEEKQATERERRRIAKNLHDDLGANLTEISLYAESIQQKITAPEVNAEMTELSERVRALAGTLDAIVWSANPANDSLDRLGTFVCGLFQDLCRVAGVRCRIDAADPLPPCPLTPDERSNLFLAAREAMTNVAKHAQATEAWLRLAMDGNIFQFTVEDNGCGFDLAAAEAGNRNGLGNIRSRVADLKGIVTFDSTRGRGTKVTIRVPLKL